MAAHAHLTTRFSCSILSAQCKFSPPLLPHNVMTDLRLPHLVLYQRPRSKPSCFHLFFFLENLSEYLTALTEYLRQNMRVHSTSGFLLIASLATSISSTTPSTRSTTTLTRTVYISRCNTTPEPIYTQNNPLTPTIPKLE